MILVTPEMDYFEILPEDVVQDEILGPHAWIQITTGTSLELEGVEKLPAELTSTCGVFDVDSSNHKLRISVFSSSDSFDGAEVGPLNDLHYYSFDRTVSYSRGAPYVCFLVQLLDQVFESPEPLEYYCEIFLRTHDQVYNPEVIGPSGVGTLPEPYEGTIQKYIPESFQINEPEFNLGFKATYSSGLTSVVIKSPFESVVIPTYQRIFSTYKIVNPQGHPLRVNYSSDVDLRVSINGYGEAPPPTYVISNPNGYDFIPNQDNQFYVKFQNRYITNFPLLMLSPPVPHIDIGNGCYVLKNQYDDNTSYLGTGQGFWDFTEWEHNQSIISGSPIRSYIGNGWSSDIYYGRFIRYDRWTSKNLAVVGSDFTLVIYDVDLVELHRLNLIDETVLGTIPEFVNYVDQNGGQAYYAQVLVTQNAYVVNPVLVGVPVYESGSTGLVTKATPRYSSLSKIIDPTPESFPITVTNTTWNTSIVIDSISHPALFKARGQPDTHYVLDVPFEGTIEFSTPTVVRLSEVSISVMSEDNRGTENWYNGSNMTGGCIVTAWRNQYTSPLVFGSTDNTLFKYVGIHWKTGTVKVLETLVVPQIIGGLEDAFYKRAYVPRSDPLEQYDTLFMVLKTTTTGYPSNAHIFMRYLPAVNGQEFTSGIDYNLDKVYCLPREVDEIIVNVTVPEEKVLYMLYPANSNRWPVSEFMPEIEVKDDQGNVIFCSTRAVTTELVNQNDPETGGYKNVPVTIYRYYLTTFYVLAANKAHKIKIRNQPDLYYEKALAYLSTSPQSSNVAIYKANLSTLNPQILEGAAVKSLSGYYTVYTTIHTRDTEIEMLDDGVYVFQYGSLCEWWDGRIAPNQLVNFRSYQQRATRNKRLKDLEYIVQPREVIYSFVTYNKRSAVSTAPLYQNREVTTIETYKAGDVFKLKDHLLLASPTEYVTDLGDGRYPWKPERLADTLYWEGGALSSPSYDDAYLPEYVDEFYGIRQNTYGFTQTNSLPTGSRDWSRIKSIIVEQYNDLVIEPLINTHNFNSVGARILRPGVENALNGYGGDIDTREYTSVFDGHELSYGNPVILSKYDIIPRYKVDLRDFGEGEMLDCIVEDYAQGITYMHPDKTITPENTVELDVVTSGSFGAGIAAIPQVNGVNVPIYFTKLNCNDGETVYLYELTGYYYGYVDGVFCKVKYFTSSQEVYLINLKYSLQASRVSFSRAPIMYVTDDKLMVAGLVPKFLQRIQWYNSATQKVVSEVIDPTAETRVFTSAGSYTGDTYDTLNNGAVTTIANGTIKSRSTPPRIEYRLPPQYVYRTNWRMSETLAQNWANEGGWYNWGYKDSCLFMKLNSYTSKFKVDVIDSSNRSLRFDQIMYLPTEQASAVEIRFKRPAAIITSQYTEASERMEGVFVFLKEQPGGSTPYYYPPDGSGVNGYLQLQTPPALAATGVYDRIISSWYMEGWGEGERARHARLTEEIGVLPRDFYSFDAPQGLRCSIIRLSVFYTLPTDHTANEGNYVTGNASHYPIWEVYLFDLATLEHKVFRLERPVKWSNQLAPVLEIDTAGMVSPVLVIPSVPSVRATPPYTGWGTGNPYYLKNDVSYEIEYTHSGNTTVDLDVGAYFPIRMLDQPIQISYTFDTFAPAVIEIESYNNENFAITHIKSSPEIINLNNANKIRYYFVPEVGGKIQIDLYNTSGVVKINAIEARVPTNYDLFYIETIEGSASFIDLDGVESTSEFWTFTGEDPGSITVTLYDENGNYEVFNDPQQIALSVVAGYKYMSVVSSVTTVITVLVDAVESVDIDETILTGIYSISRSLGFTPTDILTVHNNSNEYIYYYVKFPETATATVLLQGTERAFRSNLVIQPPHTEVVIRAVATEIITGAVFKLTRAYPKEMSPNMTIETFLQATLIKTPLMTDTTKNYILSTTSGTMLVVKPSEIVDSEVTAYPLEHNKQVTMIVFPDGAGTKLIKSVYTNYPIRTLYEDKYEDRRFSAVIPYNKQVEIQYNNPDVNGEFYAIDSSSPYPYVRNNYKITHYNYQSYGRDTDRSGYNRSVSGTIMSFDVYPRFKRGN